LATGHLAAASTVDVHEARPAPAEDSQSAGGLPPGFPAPVSNAQAPIEQLTYREEQVLAGLVRRLSNKEIAHELGISTATVKRHVANLYLKLGVGSRREAERLANSLGWVPFPATDGAAEGWPPGKVATSPR
jgi:DNA-binding NarL/FixJ family response regulator